MNVGLFYLRQLFFAKFDLKVHTDQGTQLQLNLLCSRDVDKGKQKARIIPNSGATSESPSLLSSQASHVQDKV